MRMLGCGLLFVLLQGAFLVAGAAGPFGGTVTSLHLEAAGGDPAWAATTRGLFRYREGRWHRVVALAQQDLRQVLVMPGRLLIVGADGRLQSSLDAGETWQPAGAVQGRYGHLVKQLYTVVTDPADATHLFLGTAGEGPFESWDQGVSWQPLVAGLEAEPPQAHHVRALLPSRGTRPLLLGTQGKGLFAYQEGRWRPYGSGLPANLAVEALAEAPPDPAHLALASRGAGLWESRDGGAHWAVVRKGQYGVVGAVAIGVDGVVLAHFPEEGLVTVRDGKASRPGGLGSLRVQTLVSGPGGGWLAGVEHDGVMEISPQGAIHGTVNQGLDATRILSLNVGDGSEVWAGDSNGVFFSSDGGASWEARDAGLLGAPANCLLRSGADVFLGSGGQGVYRWVAEAQAWEPRSQGLGTANTVFAFAEDSAGQSFYLGTEGGVLRSDDRGGLWTRTNSGLAAASEWRVAASPVTPGRLCAAGGGVLYQSADRGDTWVALGKVRPVRRLSAAPGKEDEILLLEESRLSRVGGGEALPALFEAAPGERFDCMLPLADRVWIGGSHGLWDVPRGGAARRAWDGVGVLCVEFAPGGGVYLGTDGAGVVRVP